MGVETGRREALTLMLVDLMGKPAVVLHKHEWLTIAFRFMET